MNPTYKNILKANTLFGGVQGLTILLSLVRTKIVAKLLEEEGIGLYSIYNETREFIHSTSNLGLDVSGVRGVSAAYDKWEEACSDEEKARCRNDITLQVAVLRSWVILLALFGILVCILLAAPLSRFTFGDSNHTWGYILLSPAVGFSTVTCGELAVLKGLRKLNSLATVSVLNVVAGIAITLPIYYLWGIEGVLPAILAFCAASMILTIAFSRKAERFQLVYTKKELREGHKALSVGFNFVICSIIGHASILCIQAYLNNFASLKFVGLYNAGYTLTMTYAGLVFAAMETDYFPRLSGVFANIKERTDTLLKQQDVTIMLATPLLSAMIVVLPLVVPLLLSGKFASIVPMAQVTTIGLLFRAIYLPNAYMSLAAGDNKTFLFINTVGAIDILLVLVGYEMYGLLGMGIALTFQNFLDMLLVMAISRWKYDVRFSPRRIADLIVFSLFLFATYAVCLKLDGWQYWTCGITLTLLCTAYSILKFKQGK